MRVKTIPTDGPIKWGYASNQWKASFQGFARKEEHLRAFKVNAACGFRAMELTASTGPWDPLGRPEMIKIVYGSIERFKLALKDCGINQITSVVYDPDQMSFEELHHGLNSTRPGDHEAIVYRAQIHAEFLAEIGGDCLAIRPVPSFWKAGTLDTDKMQATADCMNQIGAMTAERGIKTVLHIDALSALRTVEEIDRLLSLCDAKTVGLAIDTAELTIAGHDVVAFYRHFHQRVRHFQFKDALAVDTLAEYRLPNAERVLIGAGGEREIPRWFGPLGTGLVDFPGLLSAMQELGYEGWVIVESDKGPQPVAADMMSNSWYVQNVLLQ